MFSFASRNAKQIIQTGKPICRKHAPVQENGSVCSHFSTGIRGGHMIPTKRVTNFDKRILVFNKSYPTVADVPDNVSLTVLNKAKDRSRVKVSIAMMVATAFGCIAVSYSGRAAAKRGENLQEKNLEWHRLYNEKAKAAEHEAHHDK